MLGWNLVGAGVTAGARGAPRLIQIQFVDDPAVLGGLDDRHRHDALAGFAVQDDRDDALGGVGFDGVDGANGERGGNNRKQQLKLK